MNNKNNDHFRSNVQYYQTLTEDKGQRIDNFLIGYLKGVPKSHIYRVIRKGEVRVNKKRIKALYRLKPGDIVRIPPIFLEEEAKTIAPSANTLALLKNRIIYEDDHIVILNKPSGMSVHAGSTVRLGVIEIMKYLYPKFPNIELVHRLDSDTSGCLMIAKKKSILRELHSLLRAGKIIKKYWAFTKGYWKKTEQRVDLALHKHYQDGGKHVVEVNPQGKSALSVFHPIQLFSDASLVEVTLHTGRTHQIRVHAQYQKHPIAGDDRYGEAEFNKLVYKIGLKRMFLHARSLDFILPSNNKHIQVQAPLDKDLEIFLQNYKEKE